MMKNQTLYGLAVLLCAALAAADDPALDVPHVAVYGTAEIKVVPNEMIWSLTVNTRHESLAATAKQHAEAVKQVLAFLKELKISDDNVQTSRMHFGEDWNTVDRQRVKVGYVAATDIGFTLSDFGLYEKIWFGLSAMNGVSIQDTRYDHSDRIRYQDESRQKAALAARDKADKLARTLGTQIIEPLKIEEIGTGDIVRPMMSNVAFSRGGGFGGDDGGGSLAPGQIVISSKVRVYYKLMSRQ